VLCRVGVAEFGEAAFPSQLLGQESDEVVLSGVAVRRVGLSPVRRPLSRVVGFATGGWVVESCGHEGFLVSESARWSTRCHSGSGLWVRKTSPLRGLFRSALGDGRGR